MACDSLKALIELYQPDDDKRQQVRDAFEEIIADYRSAIPPEVSQTRKDLKCLASALDDAISALANLSPQSLSLLCDALDGPRGGLTQQLINARDVVVEAQASAAKLPDKRPKIDITVLAYGVAHVMATFEMKVSLTRDTDENIKGNHGGAAYCIILRQVMECAGETPAEDLYPLMKRGMELLKNPFGNEYTPT